MQTLRRWALDAFLVGLAVTEAGTILARPDGSARAAAVAAAAALVLIGRH